MTLRGGMDLHHINSVGIEEIIKLTSLIGRTGWSCTNHVALSKPNATETLQTNNLVPI